MLSAWLKSQRQTEHCHGRANFFRIAFKVIARLKPIRTQLRVFGSGAALGGSIILAPESCRFWVPPPKRHPLSTVWSI